MPNIVDCTRYGQQPARFSCTFNQNVLQLDLLSPTTITGIFGFSVTLDRPTSCLAAELRLYSPQGVRGANLWMFTQGLTPEGFNLAKSAFVYFYGIQGEERLVLTGCIRTNQLLGEIRDGDVRYQFGAQGEFRFFDTHMELITYLLNRYGIALVGAANAFVPTNQLPIAYVSEQPITVAAWYGVQHLPTELIPTKYPRVWLAKLNYVFSGAVGTSVRTQLSDGRYMYAAVPTRGTGATPNIPYARLVAVKYLLTQM